MVLKPKENKHTQIQYKKLENKTEINKSKRVLKLHIKFFFSFQFDYRLQSVILLIKMLPKHYSFVCVLHSNNP